MSQLDGLAVTIKVFLTILFVGCFVFNSFQIFLKFSEGETTTVIDIIDVEEGKMFYPVMTFCNKDGYKTEATDISDLEEYLNKTYDFEEIFEDFGIPSSYMFNEMITFKEYESTFTPFRGRCYTYRYPEKVFTLDSLTLVPTINTTFTISFHEPGEEMWFHTDWTPNFIGSTLVSAEDYVIDIQISKERRVKKDDCVKEWTNTDYAGCIKDAFAHVYHDALVENNIPNCSLPWVDQLIGYKEGLRRPCSFDEFNAVAALYHRHFSEAVRNNITQCKAPCTEITYKLTPESYSKKSLGFVANTDSVKRYIYPYYARMEVVQSTEARLITLNTFIGSVGGNLGLFLGFSCLASANYLMEKLRLVTFSVKAVTPTKMINVNAKETF